MNEKGLKNFEKKNIKDELKPKKEFVNSCSVKDAYIVKLLYSHHIISFAQSFESLKLE